MHCIYKKLARTHANIRPRERASGTETYSPREREDREAKMNGCVNREPSFDCTHCIGAIEMDGKPLSEKGQVDWMKSARDGHAFWYFGNVHIFRPNRDAHESVRFSFAHAFPNNRRGFIEERKQSHTIGEHMRERERESEYRFVRLSIFAACCASTTREKNCFDDLFFLLSFHFYYGVCCLPGSSNGARSDFRRLNARRIVFVYTRILSECSLWYDVHNFCLYDNRQRQLNEEKKKKRNRMVNARETIITQIHHGVECRWYMNCQAFLIL